MSDKGNNEWAISDCFEGHRIKDLNRKALEWALAATDRDYQKASAECRRLISLRQCEEYEREMRAQRWKMAGLYVALFICACLFSVCVIAAFSRLLGAQ